MAVYKVHRFGKQDKGNVSFWVILTVSSCLALRSILHIHNNFNIKCFAASIYSKIKSKNVYVFVFAFVVGKVRDQPQSALAMQIQKGKNLRKV